MKRKMTEAPIHVFPDFNKVFDVDYDTLNVGIGSMPSQEGKPVTFFNEKLKNKLE